jgi:hypothetical protein
MERAQVTTLDQGEAAQVGIGLRDESAIIVGFCPSDGGLTAPLPHLAAGATTAAHEGGILQSGGTDGSFSVFSPISAQDVTVYQGRVALARLTFSSPTPAQSCGLDAAPPFAVLACGAVVEVEWKTPLDKPHRPVSFVDIFTMDCASGRSASYMYRGAGLTASGLSVQFGFWRPEPLSSVCVKADAVFVRTVNGEERHELHPPLDGVIRLTHT